jgi:hypothetical protein
MAADIAAIFFGKCFFLMTKLMKPKNYQLTKMDDLYLHNKLER